MRSLTTMLAVGLAAAALHAQANGRGPTGQLIYPAKNQSAKQTEQDKFECHEWAKQQSGFDPAQAAAPMAAAPATTGTPTGGMVKGAAGGAAVAELADRDAGKGAAAGVLGAALRQRMQEQKSMSAEQQQALQQQAARMQQRGTYDRGFAACMEARDYIVK